MRPTLLVCVILSVTSTASAYRHGNRDQSGGDLRGGNPYGGVYERLAARSATLARSTSPGWAVEGTQGYVRGSAGGRLVRLPQATTGAPQHQTFMAPNTLYRPYPGQVRENTGVWALTHATKAELAKAVGPKKAELLDQARLRGQTTTHKTIEALPGIGKATVRRLTLLAWQYTDR